MRLSPHPDAYESSLHLVGLDKDALDCMHSYLMGTGQYQAKSAATTSSIRC
jgi:hypothetical protein